MDLRDLRDSKKWEARKCKKTEKWFKKEWER